MILEGYMIDAGNVLTPREKEVFRKLLQGYSNKKIANILCVSEQTIKFHCSNIFSKLNVQNRYVLLRLYSSSFDALG